MENFRAVCLLLVYAALGVLATPGFDAPGAWTTEAGEVEVRATRAAPLADVIVAAASFNRAIRLPLVRALQPLEVPLALEQSWALFASGPARFETLSIRVDGDEVYRTQRPGRWSAPELRERRVRPLVDNWVDGAASTTDGPLVWWLCGKVSAAFPDGETIEILGLWGPFPGDELKMTRSATCRVVSTGLAGPAGNEHTPPPAGPR